LPIYAEEEIGSLSEPFVSRLTVAFRRLARSFLVSQVRQDEPLNLGTVIRYVPHVSQRGV